MNCSFKLAEFFELHPSTDYALLYNALYIQPSHNDISYNIVHVLMQYIVTEMGIRKSIQE